MKLNADKIKPAVGKRMLLFLAGILWIAVGAMLLCFSYTWLDGLHVAHSAVFASIGVVAALIVHHFGFLKIVDKNLARILPMEGKRCVFSFLTWKSYMIIVLMISMGVLLRHSPIPKPYLSMLYTGIGLALILSSVRYLRVLWSQYRHKIE